jgi:hypothetical protein
MSGGRREGGFSSSRGGRKQGIFKRKREEILKIGDEGRLSIFKVSMG